MGAAGLNSGIHQNECGKNCQSAQVVEVGEESMRGNVDIKVIALTHVNESQNKKKETRNEHAKEKTDFGDFGSLFGAM